MRIVNKFKKVILPKSLESTNKINVFSITFIFICIALFSTIIGQLPFFVERSLTQIFQLLWVAPFLGLVALDYRRVLKTSLIVMIFILPFFVICLISSIFKINVFSNPFTLYVALSGFFLIIASSFSKYRTENNTKIIFLIYLFAALIYASVVFFSVLIDYDTSNPIYAFGDKNSACPIFFIAIIFAFYLFNQKKISHYILKWIIALCFSIVIILSKTRSVLLILPIFLLYQLLSDIRKAWLTYLVLGLILVGLVLVFTIPQLYQKIIVEILFNNKVGLDSISSGRITQIIKALTELKPFLGDGYSYIDCMPFLILCSYGIVGTVLVTPFLIMPFYILHKYKKINKKSPLNDTLTFISITFIVNCLFEGFGYFGPGAKSFIFWMVSGFVTYEIESNLPLHKKASDSKLNTRINNLKPNSIINALQLVVSAASLFCLISTPICNFVGSFITNRLPQANKIANYSKIVDLEIDAPVDSMCVGQTIRFSEKIIPDTCDDVYNWWGNCSYIPDPKVDVNPMTGDVTATKVGDGYVNMQYYNKDKANPEVLINFPVVSSYDYNFDKFTISTNPYEFSFDYNASDIVLNKQCTSIVYFDNFYIPKDVEVEFISSDTSIVNIDKNTGIIKANEVGECYVYATAKNGSGTIFESNKINVQVGDIEGFIPVMTIESTIPAEINEHEIYEITPIFNANVTDQNYGVIIDNQLIGHNVRKIQFSKSGHHSIKVFSLNNIDVFDEQVFEVKTNLPVSFGCDNPRISIGEKKTFEQLGIYIEFESGYRRIVTEDDLIFDYKNFSDRAWVNENGYVDNVSTIMALCKGDIKIKLQSKYNPSVNDVITVVASVYSIDELNSYSTSIGLTLISLLCSFSIMFNIFVQYKKKITSISFIVASSAIYLIIISIIYANKTNILLPFIFVISFSVTTFSIKHLRKYQSIKIIKEPVAVQHMAGEDKKETLIDYFTIDI